MENNLDVASDILGQNRILYGNGYGYGYGNLGAGNSVLAAGAHADGTALKASIDCHSEQFAAGLDRVSAQNAETRNLFKLDEILKGQSDIEFRMMDRQRDIENRMIDGQKEAAKCCCDAKVLATQQHAETLADIADQKATALAIESRAVERQLNAANAELTSLKTQIACNCNCPK